MTRRDLFHKWFIYALALLPVWVLDAFVLPRYPVLGVSPMLLPLAVVSVAVLEDSRAGAGFGLAVGLLWELAYAGGFGGLVLGMTLVGLASGAAAQYVLSRSFPSCFLCCACTLAALDGLRIIQALFLHTAPLGALLRVAAPECLLSLCWTPIVYLLFRLVYRRVGGTKLA